MKTTLLENATLRIEARKYSLETVNAALYSIVEEATSILDCDEQLIHVTLLPKKDMAIEDVVLKFNTALDFISKKREHEAQHKELKKEIFRSALAHGCQTCLNEIGFDEEGLEDLQKSLLAFEQETDDPLGISFPWREQRR